jgi:hypothetical protein
MRPLAGRHAMFLQLCTKIILAAAAAAVLLLPMGCIPHGPPAYQYSLEVARLFEPPPTLLPNHTYYYQGSPVEPDAVIAIDNRYTMTSKVWSKVDITQKILDDWAFQFDTYLGWWNCPYRGAKLFAPDGTQIGVGYSRWTFTVVKMPAPGQVIVYPPQALGSCRRQDILDDR